MIGVDAVIVGGGPAGLSAAIVLGRARRRVVLFEGGAHRNDAAPAIHAFLGHEGIAPATLNRRGREELRIYPSVEVREAQVTSGRREVGGFVLDSTAGAIRCRTLLLATGVLDSLPPVTGAAEVLGDRLHHCPYCDGWEVRDQPLAIYAGRGPSAVAYAKTLLRWSADLLVLTDGPAEAGVAEALRDLGVGLDPRPLARLVRDGDGIRIELATGAPLHRRAMFFHLGCRPRSDLAKHLGCAFDRHGGVIVDRHEATGVPGLYVAGDASRDVLLAVVAAGEGASAAVAIDRALAEAR